MSGTVLERFESKITKTKSCWEWNAAKYNNGYGAFYYNGRNRLAHRIAYKIYIGEIPKGMFVCHHCDNRWCVNPSHLFLGTHTENMIDCKSKGRNVYPILLGEKNARAKLTEAQVIEIMSRLNEGETQVDLGKEFGIAQASISLIVRGINWKHLGLGKKSNLSTV